MPTPLPSHHHNNNTVDEHARVAEFLNNYIWRQLFTLLLARVLLLVVYYIFVVGYRYFFLYIYLCGPRPLTATTIATYLARYFIAIAIVVVVVVVVVHLLLILLLHTCHQCFLSFVNILILARLALQHYTILVIRSFASMFCYTASQHLCLS